MANETMIPYSPKFDSDGKIIIPEGCRLCRDCQTVIPYIKMRVRCLHCHLENLKIKQRQFKLAPDDD
jgi:Zn finger protein HypA/HybF involved in hydrogenase expression